MCKSYIHEKAIEVFKSIIALTDELKESKRVVDKIFGNSLNYLIRKSYCQDTVTFFVFVVPNSQAKYCGRAWEIVATFEKSGEELFYYIKTAMLRNDKTKWYVFPLQIRESIICDYDSKDFVDDLTFLDVTANDACKVFTHFKED